MFETVRLRLSTRGQKDSPCITKNDEVEETMWNIQSHRGQHSEPQTQKSNMKGLAGGWGGEEDLADGNLLRSRGNKSRWLVRHVL